MKISIVHITDLHADRKIEYFNEKVRDIAKRINDLQTNEVFLLFSGDLTQSGKENQYNVVESFVNQIRAATNNKKILVACCPGNHDRDFNVGESFLKEEIDNIKSDTFYDFYEKYKHLEINYRSFEDSLEFHKRINDMLSVYDFSVDGRKIRVYSLDNSLLTHYDPDRKEESDNVNFERIVIPNDCLEIRRDNSYLCVLVMHMPLHFLNQKTKKRLVDLCNSNVDFIVDGHTHEECILKDCGDKKFLEFTSPALAANETSGFTIFEIDNETISYSNYSFDNNKRSYCLINNLPNQQVAFNRKISAFNNLAVNKTFIDDDTSCRTTNGVEFKINDIFVFPLLSMTKYANNRTVHVSSYDHFVDITDKCSAIQISSEDDMGKTWFAKMLFYYMIRDGYLPVLCSGFDFAGYFKNKNKINSYIDNQINRCYLDHDALNEFNGENNKGKRIIIIDDFDTYTEDLLDQLLKRFDKVVFFVDSKQKEFINIPLLGTNSSCKLEIEPMYRYKRQILFERIFDVVDKKYHVSSDILTKESYLETFETCLSKIDKNNTLDPKSLVELASKVLLDSKNIANVSNQRYQVYYYDRSIEDAVNLNNFGKCSTVVANRIISYVAKECYIRQTNSFSIPLLEESLKAEDELYGGDLFTDCRKFAEVLCDANILRKDENNEDVFLFYSRKVLAYFVGRYAIESLHDSNDSELMDLIIQRGVYGPLNFSILMSVASNYSYSTIPNYFVNDLYDQIMSTELQLYNNISSVKAYFNEEKQRLLDLSKKEQQRIKKSISKHEEAGRKEFLKNVDNYYYVESMDDELKEIIDLYNKMTVVSSLLCASDSIRKNEKKKLAQLVIKLPNVIIDKLLAMTKNDLDRFYVELQERAKKDDSINKTTIDEFFDYITSIITAAILSTYDTSIRFLGRANIAKEMDLELKNMATDDNAVLSNMYSIQRLMLLSFTNKTAFADETIRYINDNKGKNKYYANQAKLIARRYYFENEEFVNKKQKSLLNAIGGFQQMSIASVKNKKIKR